MAEHRFQINAIASINRSSISRTDVIYIGKISIGCTSKHVNLKILPEQNSSPKTTVQVASLSVKRHSVNWVNSLPLEWFLVWPNRHIVHVSASYIRMKEAMTTIVVLWWLAQSVLKIDLLNWPLNGELLRAWSWHRVIAHNQALQWQLNMIQHGNMCQVPPNELKASLIYWSI